MSDFITIIKNTEIASSEQGVRVTNQYVHITGEKLLEKLRIIQIGEKDGGHFLRTRLKIAENDRCMPRSDSNIESLAKVLVIDCDKRINQDGQEIEGAADPVLVHNALKKLNIGHIIYGSFSHYAGGKGNRYRIILATEKPYHKAQLIATAEAIVSLINHNLDEELLAYAKENSVFAQAWYYPRRPINSNVQSLHFEYLNGNPISVYDAEKLPQDNHIRPERYSSGDALSAIHAFNEQYSLLQLLTQYGYKRKFVKNGEERWLSPDSTSGIAGIVVRDNRFFSHHNNGLNDGYWHDAFDFMKVHEALSEHDAVKRASRLTVAPDGNTIDEHNKKVRASLKENRKIQPLPESRPPVLPLLPDMLPEAIRDYVFDVAERQQSLPDFVAVTAIVGLSGLLGRKASICPKQFDSWCVVPNQWGAIIGRPSAMKSPSMKEALRPLWEFEKQAAQEYKEAQQNHKEECVLLELEAADAKSKAKEALKKNNRDAAREMLRIADNIVQPVRHRLIVNDPSVEKLGELLNENPNGLVFVRDELSGWLANLNREEYQSARAFYLECFDGNGRYVYDRVSRGTVEIESCTLSIIGGIQPSKISMLVRDATRGIVDDGLIQRFQLAIWPDDIGSWKWIDRAPNQEAKAKYDRVFETLHNLDFMRVDEESRQFRFTSEAQELFIQWMKKIQEIARNAEVHPVLESHILKMPQTIAGLALLFEIIDGGREAVGMAATVRALSWSDYLLSHAKRLYSIATNFSLDGAKLILERKKKLPNLFSVRDIQRKGWTGLDSVELVNESLAWLLDYGYLKRETISSADTNGRPKIAYHWNN
ncbi:YfjI family protein [Legionella sp. 29fVS95]|uniref:YfjI family protein n=1 Tax=Legionella sp. 29fVS95 TaxID=3402813 RepID=UPI003AF61AD9